MPVTSNAASPSPTPNVQQEVSWQLGDSLPITNTLTLQFTGIPGASVGRVDGTADVVIDVAGAVPAPTQGTLSCPGGRPLALPVV